MTISLETEHSDKSIGYLGRKNERTLVSKVNYCSFINSLPLPNIPFNVEKGLAYILSHFHDPLWPRTIATKTTDGRQVPVYSREQALAYFEVANYQDCRISAYVADDVNPYQLQTILVMIDLDRCNFKTEKALELALSRTLDNIKHWLGSEFNPTVLWSGNGYHVYVVLNTNGVVLEHEKIFTNLTNQPTRKFLQFAETFLSCGKSDKAHNETVSFKNCMLRVPGSHNSKNNAQVTIVQYWDGGLHKPEINYLLSDFCVYLADQKAKEIIKRKVRPSVKSAARYTGNYMLQRVERLLQTPMLDGRKYSIWRILAPYLIKHRHLSAEQCSNIIVDWLGRCGQLSRLGFNANHRTKDAINHVGMYGPVYPDKMKQEHPKFYDLLLKHRVLL
jgi:hypothetical protein